MSCAQVLHRIEPDLRRPSDHAPLLVDLSISPENIRFSRKVLKRDSDEENDFLSSVTMGLCALNFSRLDSVDDLDLLSTAVSRVISNAWEANARNITVTTRSKEWWNDECRDAQEPERIGVCSALLQDLQNSPSLTTGLQRLHPPTNALGTL